MKSCRLFYSINKNLVLWARSELFGYVDDGRYLNPKHENRNPKQYGAISLDNPMVAGF